MQHSSQWRDIAPEFFRIASIFIYSNGFPATFFLTVGLLQLAEQYNVQIILTDLSPAIRHVLNIEGLDLVRALAISPEFMQMR